MYRRECDDIKVFIVQINKGIGLILDIIRFLRVEKGIFIEKEYQGRFWED